MEPSEAENRPSPAPQDNGADDPADNKRVALTFDDGPDLKWTPQILDILKERNVKATFFLVGLQAEKHPEMIQQILDEGHVIGNHTWGHKKLPELNDEQIREEIEQLNQVLESSVGEGATLFRAPYGAVSDKVQAIVDEKGYQVVGWTVDPRDWAGTTPEGMMKIVERQLKPDGIVLLHSFGGKAGDLSNTVEFLPQLIDYLQEEGYSLVTIPELS
ncbi:hypothetical protein J2TS4_36360 [Paenibacillus sp. J2TS4]|nr:hypothetical protein J2TS4_36360 [Paenibacillus sp. J2TS4]